MNYSVRSMNLEDIPSMHSEVSSIHSNDNEVPPNVKLIYENNERKNSVKKSVDLVSDMKTNLTNTDHNISHFKKQGASLMKLGIPSPEENNKKSSGHKEFSIKSNKSPTKIKSKSQLEWIIDNVLTVLRKPFSPIAHELSTSSTKLTPSPSSPSPNKRIIVKKDKEKLYMNGKEMTLWEVYIYKERESEKKKAKELLLLGEKNRKNNFEKIVQVKVDGRNEDVVEDVGVRSNRLRLSSGETSIDPNISKTIITNSLAKYGDAMCHKR